MAILPVKQEEPKTRRAGSNLLGKLGAVAGLGASIVSGNPLAIGAAGAGALQTFQPAPSVPIAQKGRPETLSAMQRRQTNLQEDPMESLREAQAALAQSGMDPQTRAELEEPILKALQARRV